MKRLFVLAGFGASLLACSAAHAAANLTMSVWNNIPSYDYYPTSSTIDNEKAYTSGRAPDSRTAIAADPYTGLTTSQSSSTAVEYTGYFNVSQAGTYTFNLNADDAARLSVGGNTIAESTFQGGSVSKQLYLAIGSYVYDAFYFQTVGGYYFNTSVTSGPAGASYSLQALPVAVPEPASVALLALGAVGAMASRRRASPVA